MKSLTLIVRANREIPMEPIFNICDAEWEDFFLSHLDLLKKTKLQWFQFRIIDLIDKFFLT